MGTEVLRPQDLLARRLRPQPPPPHLPRRRLHHHNQARSNTNASSSGRSARGRAPATILKRWEDPAALPKPYAGSGFSVSPSPSDLPMPSFPRKHPEGVNQSATEDLIRILRLG